MAKKSQINEELKVPDTITDDTILVAGNQMARALNAAEAIDDPAIAGIALNSAAKGELVEILLPPVNGRKESPQRKKRRRSEQALRDSKERHKLAIAERQKVGGGFYKDPNQNKAPSNIPPTVNQVTISVPLGEITLGGYMNYHAESQLDHSQAITLRRITQGLDQTGAKLKNGSRVTKPAHTIKWLLEQFEIVTDIA
jgi:hypothetical protein